MDRLFTAMRVFAAAAQAGSFSLAARRLETSTSKVSALISDLEEHFGIRLINRTTRRMHLTDEGKKYLAHCLHILGQIDDTENEFRQNRLALKGHLKVDVPTVFGRQYLAPSLRLFTEKYPELKLTVLMTDRSTDLIQSGVDIALRAGMQKSATYAMRRIFTADYVACASPDFLSRHGHPRTPQSLVNFRCLGFVRPLTDEVVPWVFRRSDKVFRYIPDGHLNMNSTDALIEAALHGEGITYNYRMSMEKHIDSGRLVPLFGQWSTMALPIFLVYPQSKHLSAKVRAFSEFIVGLFRGMES